MMNYKLGSLWSRIPKQLLVALVALLLLAASVACSGDTPTEAPAAVAPSQPSSAVASLVPTEPPPTPVPPTATTEPPPTAERTAPPTVAPTAVPTVEPVTPEPTEPVVFNEAVAAAADQVYGLLTQLLDELGHREGGTQEEEHAAEHLKERFDAMGYSSELQRFSFEYFDLMSFIQGRRETATIAVQSPIQASLTGLPLTTTPNGTPNSGALALVPLESDGQAAEEELEGKVALIQAGEISLGDPAVVLKLQDRVNQVAEAGAVAAVVDGSSAVGMQGYIPLLGVASPIPALLVPPAPPGVSNPLSSVPPNIEIVISVQIQTEALESQNVVAELKGEGDDVVVVGAHYDLVPQTQFGANDNSSGIAVVLSLAEALAGQSLPFTVRFVTFGAEELGLYGSSHYVSSLDPAELGRIKAMINFDPVGSGSSIALVGNSGFLELAMGEAEEMGFGAQEGMLPPGASSDHVPFESVGMPVLLMYANDVSRIHTPNDVLEYVQPERLGEAFLLGQAVLTSPKFP